jgi:hypothetical protein
MAITQGSLLRGKFTPLAPNTATIWKGKQVIKPRINYIRQILSPSKKAINGVLTRLVSLWYHQFSVGQRNEWEQFAQKINNYTPYFANNAANIIPQPRGPYSGFNAFIASNIKAFTRGLQVPKTTAPGPTQAIPEPPKNVSATLINPGAVNITWIDPDQTDWPGGVVGVVAIWIKIEGISKVHSQIAAILPIPTPQSFEIHYVRIGGVGSGAYLSLIRFFKAEMKVQMDTIYAPAPVGAVWSVGSNLATVML